MPLAHDAGASRVLLPMLALSALMLAGSAAQANDGYAQLGLGGAVQLGQTYAVSMKKEVLEVSQDLIRVDYVFERNISYPAAPVHVLFPLPLYAAQLPSVDDWYGAPRDFRVRVEGREQPFKTLVKARRPCEAFTGDRQCAPDVTAELRAAGLNDVQMAHFPLATPFSDEQGRAPEVPPLRPQQIEALRRADLLMDEGPSGERPYPTWLADVSYHWVMDFKGRKTLAVSHQYVPFTSGGSAAILSEDELRNDYCADDALIARWKALRAAPAPDNASPYGRVPGRKVDYILTTANTWGGPIEDFTLRLRKNRPEELVMLCFPGKVRVLDPLTLEIRLHNFRPRNELRVVFLNTKAPNGSRGTAPVIKP